MAASDPGERGATGRSWWTTLPGVLTAIAAVLTAVTGLVAVLAQQGVIGGARDKPVEAAMAAGTSELGDFNAPLGTVKRVAFVR